jgi:hypothetical protein
MAQIFQPLYLYKHIYIYEFKVWYNMIHPEDGLLRPKHFLL